MTRTCEPAGRLRQNALGAQESRDVLERFLEPSANSASVFEFSIETCILELSFSSLHLIIFCICFASAFYSYAARLENGFDTGAFA